MNTNFNDLPWHDAIIQTININRTVPGKKDIIEMLITWPNGSNSSMVEFFDCYAFVANMNFGVVAPETILTAECLYESVELNSIRKKWLQVGIDLQLLKCFKVVTNSTNSIINIYAENFKIINQFNSTDS